MSGLDGIKGSSSIGRFDGVIWMSGVTGECALLSVVYRVPQCHSVHIQTYLLFVWLHLNNLGIWWILRLLKIIRLIRAQIWVGNLAVSARVRLVIWLEITVVAGVWLGVGGHLRIDAVGVEGLLHGYFIHFDCSASRFLWCRPSFGLKDPSSRMEMTAYISWSLCCICPWI